jgi:2-amino-4-hydroxy-6-hydroxymethyldihydropteridine diphosphokinase
MRELSRFYLSLGSNIQPEQHLAEALYCLRAHGKVRGISSVWETRAVDSNGPNFLNMCVEFEAPVDETDLKENILRSIEIGLGRTRTGDKNAPRTIDIDIIMKDDQPLEVEGWHQAFMLLPMAELDPALPHPISGRTLAEEATLAMASTWIKRRPDVLLNPKEDSER